MRRLRKLSSPDDEEEEKLALPPKSKTTAKKTPSETSDGNDDAFESSSEAASSITDSSAVERNKSFQVVLDMITNSAMDSVIIINDKGTVKSLNQAAMEQFGYVRWEIVGKNITVLMTKKDAAKHDRYLLRYQKTKMKRIIGEMRDGIVGLHKDGSSIPFVLKVTEIVDAEGAAAFLGVVKAVKIDEELTKIRNLLNAVVPKEVSEKLQKGEQNIALECQSTVAIFELIGVQRWLNTTNPKEGITTLAQIYSYFDEQCLALQIERVKNDGTHYVVYCPEKGSTFDHPLRIAELTIRCFEYVNELKKKFSLIPNFDFRAALCSGDIIEGVIQGFKLTFDVYGEVMNATKKLLLNTTYEEPILTDNVVFRSTQYRFLFQPSSKQQSNGNTSVNRNIKIHQDSQPNYHVLVGRKLENKF